MNQLIEVVACTDQGETHVVSYIPMQDDVRVPEPFSTPSCGLSPRWSTPETYDHDAGQGREFPGEADQLPARYARLSRRLDAFPEDCCLSIGIVGGNDSVSRTVRAPLQEAKTPVDDLGAAGEAGFVQLATEIVLIKDERRTGNGARGGPAARRVRGVAFWMAWNRCLRHTFIVNHAVIVKQ